jgi:hypothetical protein
LDCAFAGFAHKAESQVQRNFISHHTGGPHRAAVVFSAHQQRRIELISPSNQSRYIQLSRRSAFGGKFYVDKLGGLVDIATDFDFIVGALAGDKPTSKCRCLRRLI